MAEVKPPFAYYGGKTTIAERIVSLLPPHGHYVELFAGSLAVLLAKPPVLLETVNDLDGDLMTFWRVLRDRPDELVRACALTPHARAEQAAAYGQASDELERARHVWVLLSQGRGGVLGRRTGCRHFRDPAGTGQSMAAQLDAYVARIPAATARLRAVSLECRPAVELVGLYGGYPDVLLYADPPYLASTRPGSGNEYGQEMRTEADHRDLATALRAARAAVVLSGYHSPLYDELYAGWHRHEISTQTTQGGKGSPRTEVLWSNRPIGAQFDLFSQSINEGTGA